MKTTIKVTVDVSWEDLKDFLEKRNLLESFVQNRIDYNGERPFSNDLVPEGWISGAFVWCNTPEKSDFWSKISHEWIGFLRQEVPQNFEDVNYRWNGDPIHSLIGYYHNSNLQGKRYRVMDNSWNREVQDRDPELWENTDDTWRDLVTDPENEKKGCLILSEYPETKRIKWIGIHGTEILEKRLIKVLVPGTNKIQWVFFDPNWVKSTNKI